AVDRGMIDLEVAGVDDHPLRRGYRQGAAVDDRMGHAQELDPETADTYGVPGLDGNQFHFPVQLVLLQLGTDQAERQGGAVDRDVQLQQDKGEGADVVFVPVGQADRADVCGPLAQPADIGDHVVDPEHVGGGKHQAAIDDENIVAVLVGHHVHADFAQAAESDNLQ